MSTIQSVSKMLRTLGFLSVTVFWFAAYSGSNQVVGQSDYFMRNRYEIDPPLGGSWDPKPTEPTFQINLNKLREPDSEFRLEETRRIIKHSDRKNIEGKDEAVSIILRELEQGQGLRLLRQAEVAALGAIGEPALASDLWRIANMQQDISYQIEQVLIRWKSPLPREVWRNRLKDLRTLPELMLLAVDGLVAIRDSESVRDLLMILRGTGIAMPVKLAAARAVGELTTQGQEEFAKELLASDQPGRDLLVASLLARHRSQTAGQLHEELVNSQNHVAAALAYESLSETRKDQAKVLASELLKHPEYRIRKQAIQVLGLYTDEASLNALGKAMHDQNMKLRDQARELLKEKAMDLTLFPVVDRQIDLALESMKSVAIEQGIILAVQLEERVRCKQIFKFLDYPDDHVRIRAGWALQELVDGPEMIEAVFQHVSQTANRLNEGRGLSVAESFQHAFLLQALGVNEFKTSESLLRMYVPENSQKMNPLARAGAIWSLGKIMAGSRDETLCSQLQERFLDVGPPDAEYPNVRYACAISMGRIGGTKDPNVLKSLGDIPPDKIGEAVQWAIENQINIK